MSNIFNLNWKDVLGSVVSAILSAIFVYVVNIGDVANIDPHKVLSIAVIVCAASLLKSLGTDSTGSFAGVIPVK